MPRQVTVIKLQHTLTAKNFGSNDFSRAFCELPAFAVYIYVLHLFIAVIFFLIGL